VREVFNLFEMKNAFISINNYKVGSGISLILLQNPTGNAAADYAADYPRTMPRTTRGLPADYAADYAADYPRTMPQTTRGHTRARNADPDLVAAILVLAGFTCRSTNAIEPSWHHGIMALWHWHRGSTALRHHGTAASQHHGIITITHRDDASPAGSTQFMIQGGL